MRRSALALLVAASLVCAATATRADELRAGFGSAPLPAIIGGAMGGFAGVSTRRAEGTLDPPEARALVLEQGTLRVAIVALDIVIPRPNLRDALLEEVAALELDLVAVVATHTHSGPAGFIPGWLAEFVTSGEYDPKQPGRLARAAARALERAVLDLAPARIASANAPLGLARNRRFSDSGVENELAVLRADFADGRPPIVFFAYGAHASLITSGSKLYSADWPGAARAKLTADGFRPIYVPGPLGDQEPDVDFGFWPTIEYERDLASDYGEAVALAVKAVADGLEPEADAQLSALERWVEPPAVDIRRFCALWWTKPFINNSIDGFLSRRVPIQVVRAGNAELLLLPAEPVATVGEALRSDIPAPRTRFVVSHVNDWVGYVVDRLSYERGSYEACFTFYGPGTGEWLAEQSKIAVDLLDARDAGPADGE